MHVLVSTDGSLDPERAARYAAPLAGPEGKVTVLTVIAIPRRLLSELRGVFGERAPAAIDGDAEYIGVNVDSGDAPVGWPGDSEMIARYLSNKEAERCAPLAAAIAQTGVDVATRAVEGEHIARTILGESAALNADVLMIGSHGEGRFEGLLGSTGTKVARHSSCPVLLIRKN